jgi:FKBP-type peptidyl-prolyl cis-trans isomerase FklB
MKNALLSILLSSLSIAVLGQTKPAPKKVATTTKKAPTAQQVPVMKNALDSFSYALGLSMASFYKQQGIDEINVALVTKALKDIKAGKPLLDEGQINNCIISYMQSKKSEAAEPYKIEGVAFLDSNRKQPGVVVTPSGLQYRIVKQGTGPKPEAGDKVKVHYQGTLINGKIFDSSIQRGEPITFGVSEVIPGWTEALQLMPVGSKWQLFIPSELGYGDNGAGADIKPGATLIFDVELLEIVK